MTKWSMNATLEVLELEEEKNFVRGSHRSTRLAEEPIENRTRGFDEALRGSAEARNSRPTVRGYRER